MALAARVHPGSLVVWVALAAWHLIVAAAAATVAPVELVAPLELAAGAAAVLQLDCHAMRRALPWDCLVSVAVLVALAGLVAVPVQPEPSPTPQSPNSAATGTVAFCSCQYFSFGSVPAGRLMVFEARNSSRPSGPSSRPTPDCLNPPKGAPQAIPNPLTV